MGHQPFSCCLALQQCQSLDLRYKVHFNSMNSPINRFAPRYGMLLALPLLCLASASCAADSLAAPPLPTIPEATFRITDYGAQDSGKSPAAMKAAQSAVDAC